ncbi:uncharacterized protein EI97DRAFT_214486 [Westerdykella ornata]|uniref:Uncharacterized protein n=1 Tax=Westerdykella ornata TaxID=318751 RepID=A0A6A6JPY6_WESOR|nr:uncharacterized protein EI97DRAFT_214486 [Westerdykella ornata]KAF2278592.1 hypothetical protein EI97DRAFT_214486 [Westerdykella ornata]
MHHVSASCLFTLPSHSPPIVSSGSGCSSSPESPCSFGISPFTPASFLSTFYSTMNSLKPRRSWLQPFLVFLGICALLYHSLAYFPSATNCISSSLRSLLQPHALPPIPCSNIGEESPREVLLAATSCLDECRKLHLDRETYQSTTDYDECKQECVARHQDACVRNQKETAEIGNSLPTHSHNFRITGRRLRQTR